MSLSTHQVREALRPIEDPELGLSIVELGLVRDIHVSDEHVQIDLTLTSPTCPWAPELIGAVKLCAAEVGDGRTPLVELVWHPPWDPHKDPTEDARAELGIWT